MPSGTQEDRVFLGDPPAVGMPDEIEDDEEEEEEEEPAEDEGR